MRQLFNVDASRSNICSHQDLQGAIFEVSKRTLSCPLAFVSVNGFGINAGLAEFFGKGFKCFGLDLLASPNTSSFASMLWIIPVLALVTYWGQSFVMQKLQPTQQQGAGQGCMKVMMYGMPLLSAYWAYIMPAAVGFYWIISALVGFAQTLITHKYFSPEQVSAKSEASRYVTLLQADRKVKPLPANLQKQIADKIEAKNQAQAERQAAQKEKKAAGKKGGNAQKNKGNSTDYLGSKK